MENHSTSILMILVHTCSPHKSQLSIFLPMLEQGGEGFKIVIGGFKIAHLGGNCPNSRGENFRHSISKNYHSVCAITVKPDVPLQATLQYCPTINCNFDRQIAPSNLQRTRTNCKLKFTKNLQTKPLIKLLAKRKPINSP
jgi:hypothetical protein